MFISSKEFFIALVDNPVKNNTLQKLVKIYTFYK